MVDAKGLAGVERLGARAIGSMGTVAERVDALTSESESGEGSAGEAADSFGRLFLRHERDVFRDCLVYLRRPEDAEDAVSEVFERGCRAWSTDRRPAGDPLPWLLLIARRLLIDRARRRRRIGWLPLSLVPASLEPAETGTTDRSEFWLWFEQLAAVLTPRQREVLLLRYQFDLPDAEVARVLGLSEPGVRSLAARALAALRANPEVLR